MTTPNRIAILGSTGSIGTRALDVVRDLGPQRVQVRALVAHNSVEVLARQVREFRPALAGLTCEGAREAWESLLPAPERPPTVYGPEALTAAATLDEVDTVLTATVGAVGLPATLAALERGRTLALANKEVLVCAGGIVTALAARRGARILPIDSEHSAVFQCLAGHAPASLRRIILTASGGPFRRATLDAMRRATRADALAHPTWQMGEKITIDSATMMNKGLEIIEAHHLFGLAGEQIDVVVHPESIVHSLVEFLDGSVIAQLSVPDMYLPILNALAWPDRHPSPVPRLDLASIGQLTFEPPDEERFPCLALARRAIAMGGTAPAVLNAANEIAVARFLAGDIALLDISELIARTLDAHPPTPSPGLEQILEADRWARQEVESLCSSRL